MIPGLDIKHYPLSVDELPSGWTISTVSKIAKSVGSGFACGRHNDRGEGIVHLRPMNVSPDGRIVLDEVKYVVDDSERRVCKGDVLFNNTNSPAWVGKTAVIDRDGDWGFSNHMTVIRPHKNIHPEFIAQQLHYLQKSGYFLHKCKNHVNQASVNSDVLANTVPILVAPTIEQQRIADRIDELFTDLDAGVAALVRVGCDRRSAGLFCEQKYLG